MRIAVDLDGVLADTLGAFIEFHNEVYNTKLVREDFHSEYYWEVLKEPKETVFVKFEHFLQTHHFQNIQPIPGAQDVMAQLAKDHHLVVLTARQSIFTKVTKQWIAKHFPKTFIDIYVINHASLSKSGNTTTKGEKCDELMIDVVIEDSMHHANDCVSDKRNVLLLDQLWNKGELPSGIHRVSSWNEIQTHKFLYEQSLLNL